MRILHWNCQGLGSPLIKDKKEEFEGWRKNIGGRRAGYNGFKQETETPDSFTQKQSRGGAIIGSFISRMRKVNLIWRLRIHIIKL